MLSLGSSPGYHGRGVGNCLLRGTLIPLGVLVVEVGDWSVQGSEAASSFKVHAFEKLIILKLQVPGRLELYLFFIMYLAHAKWYYCCLLLVLPACFVFSLQHFLRPRTRCREALAEQKAAVFSPWVACAALLFTGSLCYWLKAWDLLLSRMKTKVLVLHGTYCIVHAGLGLDNFLSQTPQGWDYRHVPPYLVGSASLKTSYLSLFHVCFLLHT